MLIAVLAICTSVAASSQASACARSFEVEDGLFLSYDEIFLAKVVAVNSIPRPESDGDQLVAEYELIESFRGFAPSKGQISEFHARSFMTSCDSNAIKLAKPGDEVLFYAHISSDEPLLRVSGVDSFVMQSAGHEDAFVEHLRKFRTEQSRTPKIEQP
jgi:hypothetical protein